MILRPGDPRTPGLILGRGRAHPERFFGFVGQTRVVQAPPPAMTRTGLVIENSERHLLVAAPTGAGKARYLLINQLLSYVGSAVVLDVKGEAAYVTALRRRRMGQRVGVIDPWNVYTPTSAAAAAIERFTLNPVELVLAGSDDLCDDCIMLTELLCGPNPQSTQDPFWIHCAKDLIAALLGWVWVRPRVTGRPLPDDGTIGAVIEMLRSDDLPYLLATILDTHGKHPEFPRWIYAAFANFLAHEGERVRTSVRSEADSLLRLFTSLRMRQATAATTMPVDLLEKGGQLTAYLIVPPARLQSHASYLRILLGSLLAVMTRRRSRVSEVPTLFMLDEVAQLGPMPQIKQAVTLLRGYGVRLAMAIQSLSQLKGLWPTDWETIIDNCGCLVHFGATTLAAARQVADQLGDINADDLFGMAPDEMAVHVAGQRTRILQRIDYLHDPLFAGQFEPNPYHVPLARGAAP